MTIHLNQPEVLRRLDFHLYKMLPPIDKRWFNALRVACTLEDMYGVEGIDLKNVRLSIPQSMPYIILPLGTLSSGVTKLKDFVLHCGIMPINHESSMTTLQAIAQDYQNLSLQPTRPGDLVLSTIPLSLSRWLKKPTSLRGSQTLTTLRCDYWSHTHLVQRSVTINVDKTSMGIWNTLKKPVDTCICVHGNFCLRAESWWYTSSQTQVKVCTSKAWQIICGKMDSVPLDSISSTGDTCTLLSSCGTHRSDGHVHQENDRLLFWHFNHPFF